MNTIYQLLNPVTIFSNSLLLSMLLAVAPAAAENIRIGYTSPTPNQSVLWVAESRPAQEKRHRCRGRVYAR